MKVVKEFKIEITNRISSLNISITDSCEEQRIIDMFDFTKNSLEKVVRIKHDTGTLIMSSETLQHSVVNIKTKNY